MLEDDLADRYADFERTHQCEARRYPLKDSLLSALGHPLVQIPLRAVIPINLKERFDAEVRDEGVTSVLRTMTNAKPEPVEMEEEFYWMVDACIHLVSNVVTFVLLPVPLVIVAFLYQQEAQALTLDRDRFFTFGDVLLGPDPSVPNWPNSYIALQNLVLFYSALAFYGLLMIDFACYLLEHFDILSNANIEVKRAFEAAAAKAKAKRTKNSKGKVSPSSQTGSNYSGPLGWRILLTGVGARYLLHKFFAGMVIFVCFAIMAYVGLVGVWASLAAIINPTRFLAYTTGVLSSVGVVAARLQSLAGSRDKLRKQAGACHEANGSSSLNVIVVACQGDRKGQSTRSRHAEP